MQFKTWATCQLCGEVVASDKADGWLVSPRRSDPSILVVRCPQHISEWSLRQSQAGRTKAWRLAMAEGRKQKTPGIPPLLSPFPTQERR